MTRQELLIASKLYKKEVMRRLIVLIITMLLPGTAIFIGIGFWLHSSHNLTMGVIFGFFIGFALFVISFMAVYFYMVIKSLPRKLGFLCPFCGTSFLEIPAEKLISEGKCESFGNIIITADTVPPVDAHVV